MRVTEEQFRAHYFDADRAQWRFAMVLFSFPVIAFGWFDYALYGLTPAFYGFITVRLLLLTFSIWLWFHLPRVESAATADRLLAVWGILGIAIIVINAIGRPRDYYGHYVFEVFAVLLFYSAVPMPPRRQLALMMLYLPVALAILIFYKQAPIPIYTGNVSLVLVLTVASGYLISRRIDRYRMTALVARLELEQQARTDPLTCIANRRAFMEWAGAEVARQDRNNRPLSLLMLDIDHFKAVNDQHGHAAGDELLVEFTQRVAAGLRRYDQFARLGGEEFLIALPDCDLSEALHTAERLRRGIASAPFSATGQAVAITASVGVTRLHGGETRVEGMLKRADAALYAAKDAGRNRVEAVG